MQMGLTRCFSVRNGLKSENDNLFTRYYGKIINTGHVVKETDFKAMLKDYYTLRGWNESGVPKIKPIISSFVKLGLWPLNNSSMRLPM